MLEIKPIKLEDVHLGTVGYVEFQLHNSHDHRAHLFSIYILCEIVGISGDRLEICAIGSDRTCLWIDKDKIYQRIVRK